MEAVSSSTGAGVSALRPMLPVLADLPTGAGRWSFEVKWDGVRTLASVADRRVRLRSRSRADLTATAPELEAPPAALAGRSALLDGELIAVDAAGRPDFEAVTRRLGCTPPRARQLSRTAPLTFVAFDLLWLDDAPLVNAPYADRRARLEALDLNTEPWVTTPAWTDGAALWEATAAQQLEGVIAKRLDSRYRPGRRSRGWIKAKHWRLFGFHGVRPG